MAVTSSRVLSAPLHVAFDYTRSTGPVLGAFFTGLRERRVLGSRTADGRVVVPPVEFDPSSHAAISAQELVEVGTSGTVQTWTWVSHPVPGQPLSDPFAFAMVVLDGATEPMLHAVRAAGPEAMSTGMRVAIHWAEERQGAITDIAWFEPEDVGVSTSSTTEDGSTPEDGSTTDDGSTAEDGAARSCSWVIEGPAAARGRTCTPARAAPR